MKDKYQKALDLIMETFSGGTIWRLLLPEVVYEIKSVQAKYDWVGIYLLKGDMLILETFLGKPTEHSKIKVTDGICGFSITENKSILVDDVTKDNRYIACDIAVKSEIVVPIKNNDRMIGVIDIDSNQRNAFKQQDKDFLESVANLLGSSCPKNI